MARPRTVENDEILKVIAELQRLSGEPFSSEHVGGAVGLSRPTINRRLKEMVDQKLISVKDYRDEAGHRRYTVRILAKGRRRLGKATA